MIIFLNIIIFLAKMRHEMLQYLDCKEPVLIKLILQRPPLSSPKGGNMNIELHFEVRSAPIDVQ